MAGWRAVDQEPVASRQAIAEGFEAVLAAIETMAHGTRPVVAACWQDEAYIDVPTQLLARVAEVADLIVACAGRPRLPEGVCHIVLDDTDPVTDEWSIVALAGTHGLALVAHEIAANLPAGTVEGGRAFRYDVSDEAPVVIAHARRLARVFGARQTPASAALLAEATTALVDAEAAMDHGHHEQPEVPVSLHDLPDRIHALVDAADGTRRDSTMEPAPSGLVALAGWLADAGPRAPALGMVVVRADVRGVTAVLRENARAVGRIGDLIVDVPPDAAMLVLPGLRGEALQARADEVCAMLTEVIGAAGVDACAVEVPAEHARRDLVGSLSMALTQLRAATPAAMQDVRARR